MFEYLPKKIPQREVSPHFLPLAHHTIDFVQLIINILFMIEIRKLDVQRTVRTE